MEEDTGEIGTARKDGGGQDEVEAKWCSAVAPAPNRMVTGQANPVSIARAAK